jgi:endonuclease/exonuclease/phosphatase family metal-dependent hydrolase
MSHQSELTFVAMTYNLWGNHHLDERVPALQRFFALRAPDLLATQELRPPSRDLIDDALPGHERIQDAFPGWSGHSNLWWRTAIFTLVEYGATDVGIRAEHARLFWVRLQPANAGAPSLVFSTAHLSWPGNQQERSDGRNARTTEAIRIVEALNDIAGDGPCLFTVDINDIAEPNWTFGNAGFLDSFTALGRHSPPTHPVIPRPFATELATPMSPLASPTKAIDWIFHRGSLQPRTSEVVEFFDGGHAPSDHYPVVATYTMTSD